MKLNFSISIFQLIPVWAWKENSLDQLENNERAVFFKRDQKYHIITKEITMSLVFSLAGPYAA